MVRNNLENVENNWHIWSEKDKRKNKRYLDGLHDIIETKLKTWAVTPLIVQDGEACKATTIGATHDDIGELFAYQLIEWVSEPRSGVGPRPGVEPNKVWF